MSTFLQLPRELRDQIYGYIVHAEKKRPDLNQSFDQLVEPRILRGDLASRPTILNQSVLYLPQHDLNNSIPLLLVNRQIRAEAFESLSRTKSFVSCSLDIVILDEILLLPTWLSAPVQRTDIDTVNVTFRIAGSFQRGSRYDENGPYAKFPSYSGFAIADIGGQAMKYQVYEILRRFIKHGPVGQAQDTKNSKHATAKCIRIEFLTPEGVPDDKFVGPLSGHRVSSRDKAVEGGVLHPLYLSGFVRNQLDAILKSDHYQWFEYGKLLFEHVDKIVLLKDGVEFKRWDVAECLRTVSVVQEHYVSREELRVYKQEAWQLRKARGLKVLEDQTEATR